MRVVFMGTGEIGIPALRFLTKRSDIEIAGVVSQPDRPAGRGLKVKESPIAREARSLGLPLQQPDKIRAPEVIEALAALRPDVLVVMAYGQLLPKPVLELPSIVPLNLHTSLLPRHRGAAPIAAAILAGDDRTGITVMRMTEGLDCGDILLERDCPIGPDDTAGSLHDRLALLAAPALAAALDLLASGAARYTPQDEALATHAPKLRRENARMDWNYSCEHLERLVRAMHPWPGAFTELGRRILKIHTARAASGEEAAPGTVLGIDADGLLVACGRGALLLREVQLEGRKRMDAAAFARGTGLKAGDRLGGEL